MISSIFGKTKPINYIIILAFLFFLYWFIYFSLFGKSYALTDLLLHTLVLLVFGFSFFVVNFVLKRNKVTGANSFGILFYALLCLVFPETLMDNNAILCSFFLLLATRRLISMRSLRAMKSKIFDATLWIAVSSLFYDWAFLYMILVFAAIAFYEPKNIRNWMVPFAALFAAGMIAKCFIILAGIDGFLADHYQFHIALNVAYFSYWGHSTKFVLFVLITVIAGFLAFLKLGKTGLGRVITVRLIALSFAVGLVLNILKLADNVYPVMVLFFPSAVFLTKYVESIRRPNIKEIVLMAAIFIPFLIFISSVLIR